MNQARRILVVEDEAMIALCLEMELKKAGYVLCKRVARGEDAVLTALRDLPDVILMDIRLAGPIDGIEAAHRIQAATTIPVIFMTGYPDKAIEERARALSPLGFFVKPVRLSAIRPLIDSVERYAPTR